MTLLAFFFLYLYYIEQLFAVGEVTYSVKDGEGSNLLLNFLGSPTYSRLDSDSQGFQACIPRRISERFTVQTYVGQIYLQLVKGGPKDGQLLKS